ncbi:MAG: phosphate acyltransferase PlsX [Thermoleophilaceae bacterium]|nr:phosphate acyltransferase PlsX [Thermoleophilaceae bacterium]
MIALDINGADRGPRSVAEGARLSGVPVTLFGPVAELPGETGVVDAPVAIGNDEEPARAVRAKPEASIVVAAKAVASGDCEALVSAGSTGAALAASVFHIKRLHGVHRPAVAVLLPIPGAPTLMLDVGASSEARPEQLVQFAHMGSAFMQAVHGVERPRVGLLSIGEEPNKGTPAVVEAHARLAASPGTIDFIGNVEGHDVPAGAADVVVTDGFTGNVALKLMEGTAKTVTGAVRDAVRSGLVSSLGGLLVRRRVGRLRDELDPNATGGAILLGLRKVVVIAHGSSTPEGIANAVRLADRAVRERVLERMAAALTAAGALRSARADSVGAAND